VKNCTMTDTSAAPRAPISGAPRLPKMKTQLSAALTKTAATVTHSTTCVRPSAAR
jgi:hypothetical protein